MPGTSTRRRLGTPMAALLDKMTPFMIVRHPFVRLVSAYEDKMLNPHPFPFAFHHKIQETIKKRRTSKNKRISFPRDLLNSARYQHMLYCTVLYCTVQVPAHAEEQAGHAPAARHPARLPGVRGLAHSREVGQAPAQHLC